MGGAAYGSRVKNDVEPAVDVVETAHPVQQPSFLAEGAFYLNENTTCSLTLLHECYWRASLHRSVLVALQGSARRVYQSLNEEHRSMWMDPAALPDDAAHGSIPLSFLLGML